MFKFRSRTTTLAARLADKVIFMVIGALSFLVCIANVGFEGIVAGNPVVATFAWLSLVTFVVAFICFIYSLIRFVVFTHFGHDEDSPSNVVICAHDKFYTILLIIEVIILASAILRAISHASEALMVGIYMAIPVVVVTFVASLTFYTMRLIYKYSH